MLAQENLKKLKKKAKKSKILAHLAKVKNQNQVKMNPAKNPMQQVILPTVRVKADQQNRPLDLVQASIPNQKNLQKMI